MLSSIHQGVKAFIQWNSNPYCIWCVMGWDSQDQLEGFLSEEGEMKFAVCVLMAGTCLLL